MPKRKPAKTAEMAIALGWKPKPVQPGTRLHVSCAAGCGRYQVVDRNDPERVTRGWVCPVCLKSATGFLSGRMSRMRREVLRDGRERGNLPQGEADQGMEGGKA
ncbi:MAG: hypothetical protein AAGI68_11840 [Planctomycetota bacterium]